MPRPTLKPLGITGPGATPDDPLGLGLQQRGMENWQENDQSAPGFLSGPLPDPKWLGFLQALHERGVSGVGQMGPASSGLPVDSVDQLAALSSKKKKALPLG